jgi:hypothetical protein
MTAFDESVHVIGLRNAAFFASQLFLESFAAGFPIPREQCGLPISTPPEAWRQYVAFYKWSDGALETVGFCNWIRYGDVYLEGGMCVRKNFYRRLPKEHWNACKARGGIAQIILRTAERELNDCLAWFGYCGDKKSQAVHACVGYQSTDRPYLIVKWLREPDAQLKRELIDRIAAIGPF